MSAFFFFWLRNVELAIERVKIRVTEGGHNIKSDIIRRRYTRGIRNLFEIYIPLFENIMIFDNSEAKPELIAEKQVESSLSIINQAKFEQLRNS